ncbi:TetM/TetW/TetO/TetS family tetracycline resistance ribosomal protection protein [Streptomyces albus subsp. chlorinus]|uniref:elongation factor G n=1 Tax=Streptomyces albus TaxID=1888 RepID=UPI0015707EEF|nr:TetM/TetW/TetO/TetS family tetracycline resistance ribosomal protection protein [Streptomyces albus]NSC20219.1 TetM/TetW/TetO/TetS family tetracycline resistance ribosomal protection protein [Streptomyces albus subsp. chlorinus]
MPASPQGRAARARTPHPATDSRCDTRPREGQDTGPHPGRQDGHRTGGTRTATRNIGILAHVDAGKTSLTERLLYDTGVIGTLGSVDAGTTQTDTGSLERQRGITVRSAVASFTVGDTRVNLIDTPGHADFVAEVERALGVLDGAVLVLSAVEGVQPQTRVLMRTLRERGLPTLLFANKIDRTGARYTGLIQDIRRKLAPHAVPLTRLQAPGTRAARALPVSLEDDAEARAEVAETLAELDEKLLARVVDGPQPTPQELRAALADHTARGAAHPLFFGSALTGQGVAALVRGMADLLPGAPRGLEGAGLRGKVFAVERGTSGARTAYVRLFAGELTARRHVTLHRRSPEGTREEHSGQITSLEPVGAPGTRPARLVAGDIGRIRGLARIRVGDVLTDARGTGAGPGAPDDAEPPTGPAHFAPPTLQSLVRPAEPGPAAAARLHTALTRMAEEDPLLHARAEPDGATSLLLYGEVQKEIIAATLAQEHGIEAVFTPSRTVCRERPVGTGEAEDGIGATGRHTPATSGHWATVGLRVEPGPRGSGVVFRYETELGALPYAFHRAVEESVHTALRTGPHGWAVTDCVVTLVRSGFAGPVSTAGDFRGLTPLVLAKALERAGTRVYEPYHAFEVEVPLDSLPQVTRVLAASGATLTDTAAATEVCVLTGTLPARHLTRVQQALPGLTRGEAAWWSRPAGEQPLTGRDADG